MNNNTKQTIVTWHNVKDELPHIGIDVIVNLGEYFCGGGASILAYLNCNGVWKCSKYPDQTIKNKYNGYDVVEWCYMPSALDDKHKPVKIHFENGSVIEVIGKCAKEPITQHWISFLENNFLGNRGR
jgi:hypothetical protein